MGTNYVDRKLNVKLRDVFMNPGTNSTLFRFDASR